MNSPNDPLDRLLKSAASAPRTRPAEAGFALEARVLAGWRAAARSENNEFLVAWFRRAALCALALAIVSLAWNYRALAGSDRGYDELAVADATMRAGVGP